jgi:hypothetical protein
MLDANFELQAMERGCHKVTRTSSRKDLVRGLSNGLTAANKNDLVFIAARIKHVINHLGIVAEDTSDGFVIHDLPKLAVVNL